MNAGMPGRVESYFDNPNTFAEDLDSAAAVGSGIDFLLPPLVEQAYGKRCVCHWCSGPGHDLFPGKLGRNGLCHGRNGIFVEAAADPGICGAELSGDTVSAGYHLEPDFDHCQSGGFVHGQPDSRSMRLRWK